MANTECLDYSKPPPEYTVQELCILGRVSATVYVWETTIGGVVWRGEQCERPEQALHLSWAHYKSRHDPPGLRLHCEESQPDDLWTVTVGDANDIPGQWISDTAARAAAWVWYDRRLALATSLDSHGLDIYWPRCLAWSDEQVDAVERWLADTSAPFPEVLRD